jgi:hypothetical protein
MVAISPLWSSTSTIMRAGVIDIVRAEGAVIDTGLLAEPVHPAAKGCLCFRLEENRNRRERHRPSSAWATSSIAPGCARVNPFK